MESSTPSWRRTRKRGTSPVVQTSVGIGQTPTSSARRSASAASNRSSSSTSFGQARTNTGPRISATSAFAQPRVRRQHGSERSSERRCALESVRQRRRASRTADAVTRGGEVRLLPSLFSCNDSSAHWSVEDSLSEADTLRWGQTECLFREYIDENVGLAVLS